MKIKRYKWSNEKFFRGIMQVGIYPGSFDPLTNGHIDIINRAENLCDKLIIAVAHNSDKNSLFSMKEREDMLKEYCAGNNKIEITSFNGLLVDYCINNNISFIVRGLRATVDFEYEYAISLMNKRLAPKVETIFLLASTEYSFVSSKIVKEVASYGGDISSLVPNSVIPKLSSKFTRK